MNFWQRFHYQWQIRWISNICIFRYVFIVGQNYWDSQYKLAIRKLHGREIVSNFCLLLKMHDHIKSCNIFSFTVWAIVSYNITWIEIGCIGIIMKFSQVLACHSIVDEQEVCICVTTSPPCSWWTVVNQ